MKYDYLKVDDMLTKEDIHKAVASLKQQVDNENLVGSQTLSTSALTDYTKQYYYANKMYAQDPMSSTSYSLKPGDAIPVGDPEYNLEVGGNQYANWKEPDVKKWPDYSTVYHTEMGSWSTGLTGTTAVYPGHYSEIAKTPHTGIGVPHYFLLALSVLKNNLIKSLQAKGNETYRNWIEKIVANEVDIITQKLKGGEEVVG